MLNKFSNMVALGAASAAAVAMVLLWVIFRQPSTPPPQPPHPTSTQPPPNLSELGTVPDWSVLEAFQGTIAREDFLALLESVYAKPGAWQPTISVTESAAIIRKISSWEDSPVFTLRFAPKGAEKAPPRRWRKAAELPPLADPDKPLTDVRLAIDPGHIGGAWAKIEERHYQRDTGIPVQEGDLTLATAKLLAPMLERLGADVVLLREKLEPVTPLRPPDLMTEARKVAARSGASSAEAVARRLFYRTAEIRARAAKLTSLSQPVDFVLCLHFNAESWGHAARPTFSPENHLHVLLHGGFEMGELSMDDQRFEMLHKLLQGIHAEEKALCAAVANGLALFTRLPAYTYRQGALPVEGEPYLWLRNLLANRLYPCPVVFCEPYVMNNEEVFHRIQLGDYEGEKDLNGTPRLSIFQEYASGVAAGLRQYFSAQRTRPKTPAASAAEQQR